MLKKLSFVFELLQLFLLQLFLLPLVVFDEGPHDDCKNEVEEEEGADEDEEKEVDSDVAVDCVHVVVHDLAPPLHRYHLEDGQNGSANIVEVGNSVVNQFVCVHVIIRQADVVVSWISTKRVLWTIRVVVSYLVRSRFRPIFRGSRLLG